MQTDNRILDDIAKLASGTFGIAAGFRGEAEAMFKARLQALLADMDLVPREEFDAVKAIASAARAEQEILAEKLASLEAKVAALGHQKKPAKR